MRILTTLWQAAIPSLLLDHCRRGTTFEKSSKLFRARTSRRWRRIAFLDNFSVRLDTVENIFHDSDEDENHLEISMEGGKIVCAIVALELESIRAALDI